MQNGKVRAGLLKRKPELAVTLSCHRKTGTWPQLNYHFLRNLDLAHPVMTVLDLTPLDSAQGPIQAFTILTGLSVL